MTTLGRIEHKVFLLRGERVMLDVDLAELYAVPTRTLKQAVRRNIERFPADFMFELSWEESRQVLRSRTVILERRGRHLKYRPFAFTDSMPSGNSWSHPRGASDSIAISRRSRSQFVTLKTLLLNSRIVISGGPHRIPLRSTAV
jgi:hypothetical protein